jgi:hypothetical protein
MDQHVQRTEHKECYSNTVGTCESLLRCGRRRESVWDLRPRSHCDRHKHDNRQAKYAVCKRRYEFITSKLKCVMWQVCQVYLLLHNLLSICHAKVVCQGWEIHCLHDVNKLMYRGLPLNNLLHVKSTQTYRLSSSIPKTLLTQFSL